MEENYWKKYMKSRKRKWPIDERRYKVGTEDTMY